LGTLLAAVDAGRIPLARAIGALTIGPASVLGEPYGGTVGLAAGQPADLVVFDRSESWTVRPGDLLSRGKNSPLVGRSLPGRVLVTLARGQLAYEAID
jgi:dihydroorotase